MISVIIPAYNAEATIKKCIQSVLGQLYSDLQVIVVNDGSTDTTQGVCEEFNDPRLVLIKSTHRGVAGARNVGIEFTKGEYIFFLDADDILAKNALFNLVGYTADLVISGYTYNCKSIIELTRDYLQSPNKNTALAFVWGKLFKTSIIRANNIRFKDMNKHEDTEFVFNYLYHVGTIKFINERTVIHIQPETGKGMEVFDTRKDRAMLIATLRKLVNDEGLLSHCANVLKKVDAVRACRTFNILHPLLSFKAIKRYTPVIIFGAGSTGKLLYEQCQKKHIRVECFCDEKDIQEFCGLRVLSPSEAKRLFPSARFMITTSAVKDVTKRLQELGFTKFLYRKTARLLKNIKDVRGYARFCLENCIEANLNHDNPYYLRSLDLMITEKCTLKCRDCSNLMQYYTKPKDYSIASVYAHLLELLRHLKIGEIRVIGGEPLIHKYLIHFLNVLVEHKKVRRIVVYTNGTLPIEYHDVLRSPKILFMVTDYGKLSKNLKPLIDLFTKHNIAYEIQSPEWSDCGKIDLERKPTSRARKLYAECCSKNTTLCDGKIYHCAFAANLARLGVYDGEDITGPCTYCNGRPLNTVFIDPAIQITGCRTIGS